jgi:hypothetical protein
LWSFGKSRYFQIAETMVHKLGSPKSPR